ncbi:MAG: hypothetical protein AMK70_02235 [Nitrospira bacterium SG8_35_1]|nr:MAG: hypothetical protein AMK70_02235 [Nitrospira bacterium SG8_35_1]
MPKIGLTGNFGMGKSTVLRLFRKLGAHTFDCDNIVRNLLKNPGIIQQLSRMLGEEILLRRRGKSMINKKRMAEIIFSHPAKRKAVEKIIHPAVVQQIEAAESELVRKNPCPLIVFEVPLLFEAGLENRFDTIITVFTTRERSSKRLLEKGFTPEEIKNRMRAQMPVYRKKELSDFVIDNSGDLRTTELQVRKIVAALSSC